MKTINDLGIESSLQYAKNQSLLDTSLVKDSSFVTKQSQIDVTAPYYSSEYEMLFEVSKRNINWADFFSPPYYYEQRQRIFTFQLAPSLGSEDAFQTYAEKIQEKVEKDKRDQKERKRKHHEETEWDEEISLKQEEKESKILIQLLEHIGILDKILTEINSKRNQYQRG